MTKMKWLREVARLEFRTDAGKVNIIGFFVLAAAIAPLSDWGRLVQRLIWAWLLPHEPFPSGGVSQSFLFVLLAVVLLASVFFVAWAEKRD